MGMQQKSIKYYLDQLLYYVDGFVLSVKPYLEVSICANLPINFL